MGKDAKLSVKDSTREPVLGPSAGDLELVRGYLEIRARPHELLGLAGYHVYRALNDRYLGKVLATVAEGMRVPTIEEVRRFDRVLHTDLLRHLARGWRLSDPGYPTRASTRRTLELRGSEPSQRQTCERRSAKKTPSRTEALRPLRKSALCVERSTPLSAPCLLVSGRSSAQSARLPEPIGGRRRQRGALGPRRRPRAPVGDWAIHWWPQLFR